MRDSHARKIDYMRISITDRCNFSCCYCCTNEKKVTHEEILRYEEIYKIVQAAVKVGIVHFRVTGGEPLVRKGCINFLEQLLSIPGVESVGITTNGYLLSKEKISQLKRMGIDSINISLDSLDYCQFGVITGQAVLEQVKKNIEECIRQGLKIKINAVWGFQKDEEDIKNLLYLAKNHNIAVRFIEEMPMGTKRRRSDDCKEVICALLKKEGFSYQEIDDTKEKIGFGPASYVSFSGFAGKVGFIEPLHHKFCANCNRLRLTARGELRMCLYHSDFIDVKEIVRKTEKKEEIGKQLEEAFLEAIAKKPGEHYFNEQPAKAAMYMIGG